MKTVKCLYCGQPIDRDKEKYQRVQSRRYAHLTCHVPKSGVDETLTTEIMEYCKEIFGPEADYGRIGAQIKKYVADGKTRQDILLTLKYWYGVKKNNTDKSNGGIGIVPYVYDEAKKYWKSVAPKRVAKMEEEVVYVKRKKNKTLLEKMLEEV